MIPNWLKLLGFAAAVKVLHKTLNSLGELNMYNCHEDILAYHNEKVTLPRPERKEMRDRRDTNRQRLTDGLKRDEEPSIIGCRSQGSYAHRTMVQHPEKDYDIDDGAFFWKEDLKGPKGGDKSARDTKEMVRKALHDERFARPPEVRTNCVRIYYNEGYHVDVPVYRQVKVTNNWSEEEVFCELASWDWKRSDPTEVTRWFDRENKAQSPDTTNGRQLRRQTRLIKSFARSRESWRPRIATGFMITTLIVDECYHSNLDREDGSLYRTMRALRDRLERDLEIRHPVVNGEKLTRGVDDGRTRFLRDKLTWAIDELDVIFDPDCTREKALRAWDKVFGTDFFRSRLTAAGDENQSNKSAAKTFDASSATGATAAILTNRTKSGEPTRPVDKRGGGRYA